MRLSLLLGIAVSAGLVSAPAFAQQRPAGAQAPSQPAATPQPAPETGGYANAPGAPVSSSAQGTPLQLRNGAVSTGLSGFYDYQANGVVHGRIWVSPADWSKIYTVYMLATDGTDTNTLATSRRVGYAYSTDGGATWQSTREIQPGFRLGFPYMDVAANGTPYIAVHGDPDGQGTRTLIYSGTPGATTFTRTGTYERLSYTGRDGDQGAGVIWPGFVISPADPTKHVVVATLSPKSGPPRDADDPVHFSVAPIGTSTAWDIISDAEISTSSGGRNVLAKSAGGKIGLAYYHSDDGGGSGIYFTESTNGGVTWNAPVKVMNNNTLPDGDTVSTNATLDFTYNGEEPVIAGSGFSRNTASFAFAREAIFVWTPSKGLTRAVIADSTKLLGLVTTFARQGESGNSVQPKQQPNMPELGYPSISVGDDGRHIVVTFSAVAQYPGDDEEHSGEPVVSEDQFFYHRLWVVGSPDGGATWGEPRIIQDFAGEGTDSASIEYPVAAPIAKVTNNNFEHIMTFQARRFPGMYAFVVADIDTTTGNQPADRGPINETFQYFQRTTLDPTLFGEPASVDNENESRGGMKFVKSFPNPASGSFTVSYELSVTGKVSLKVYNMLGAEVMAPMVDETGYAGTHTRTIDVSALGAGSYRVLLTQNGRSITAPLTIVR